MDAVGLLQRSAAWSQADQQSMEEWFRAYLQWLRGSEEGQEERDWHNNHGTWWDVQAVSFALFVGDTALAREVLEAARARLDQHVMADGSQPHELERTRSFSYSAYNLEAFSRLAEMGRQVDVDLWRYQAPGGGTVRRALDFLVPFVRSPEAWPYEQITPVGPEVLLLHLRRARAALRDPRYDRLIDAMPDSVSGAHRSQLLYPDPPKSP